jgi:uncharacterized protein DUF2784
MPMLQALNIFFFVFHSLLIAFNLFGFLFRKTRLANLICLLLTGFSWYALGIWYGFGYCFLADWHMQVRRKIGIVNDPHSYVKLLIDTVTGWDVNSTIVDALTATLYFVALACSLTLNLRDFIKKRKLRKELL